MKTSKVPPESVLRQHFEQGLTLQEIGDIYNLTRQRIHQGARGYWGYEETSALIRTSKRVRYQHRIDTAVMLYVERRYSISRIAREINIDSQTVTRWLQTAGITIRSSSNKDNSERNRNILWLNRRGMTQTQIAGQLDISQSIVSQVLIAAGIRSKVNQADRDQSVILMRNQGMSNQEIARQLDISRGYVSMIASRHGLPRQNRSRTARQPE